MFLNTHQSGCARKSYASIWRVRLCSVILTWQDWTSMDSTLRNPDINIERINVPADPRHYWRWRMHITLEELMKQDEFNEYIRSMIEESGRSVSEQTEEAE